MENPEIVPEAKPLEGNHILDAIRGNMTGDEARDFLSRVNSASKDELGNAVNSVADELKNEMGHFFTENRELILKKLTDTIIEELGPSHMLPMIEKTIVGDDFDGFKSIVTDIREGKSFFEILPMLMGIKDNEILNQVRLLFQADVLQKDVADLQTFILRFYPQLFNNTGNVVSPSFTELLEAINRQSHIDDNQQRAIIRHLVGPVGPNFSP